MLRISQHRAFSLLDLLLALAVVAMLLGLLLPAVQKARVANAQITCQHNLKQTGLGLLSYESAYQQLPPASVNTDGARCGWPTFILPYIDQPALAKAYRTDADWYQPVNKVVVTNSVSIFVCPTSPKRDAEGKVGEIKWKAATGDYSANVGLDAATYSMGIPLDFDRGGPFRGNRRLLEITDGRACTVLLSEQAGRPQAWRKGQRVTPDLEPDEGVWASGRNSIDARAHSMDGKSFPGPCAINCTNSRGVYSFHVGYANVCFADGSVRSLREGLDVYVYYSLLTSRGAEILSPQDY